MEPIIELAQYLIHAAQDILRLQGEKDLPKQLARTAFYVAYAHDNTIIAHGVVAFNGTEYKIGPKLELTEVY